MKSFVLFLSVALFLIPVFAQTPTPTPSDDTVVKISTTLIQIDAKVTDKKGNVVNDLKPEDFEIYENGKKQKITNFSFVSALKENNQSNQQVAITSSSNVLPPSVKLNPEQARRTYAIVVDDLGLSHSSAFFVKAALKKFVNEQMQEGDLVAILRTGVGIGALQSFTSDKRQLLAAVEKIRWNPRGRIGIGAFEPIRDDRQLGKAPEQNILKRSVESDLSSPSFKGAEEEKFEKEISKYNDQRLASGTFGALRYIINGLREMPGRKSVMLVSEGFSYSQDTISLMRVLSEFANRSSVVIYAIDPRGLINPYMWEAQDNVQGRNTWVGSKTYDRHEQRIQSYRDSRSTLNDLARSTGGLMYGNNDINEGFQKVLDDQEGYYLLGYQPDEDTFDAKKARFNKLEVRLKRPDLKIRYRNGFFGISDEKIKNLNQTPQQKIVNALISPFGANNINLSLYSVFYNDSQDKNYIRALVHIDAKDLTFTLEPDGFYRTKFEIIAGVFDSNGYSADNGITETSMQFSKEKFQRVQKEGIVYNLVTPIIVNGGYQFRIAVRDPATDKIGSASQFIEVPDLKKKNLTLSQLVVRGYSMDKWKEFLNGKNNDSADDSDTIFLNTSLREFKRGMVVSYYYVIYNAQKEAQLQTQNRLFYNGKLLLEGTPAPLDTSQQTDLQRIEVSKTITLGTDLKPGDYVLQVIVSDNQAKKKNQIATQSIDFRIIE